MTIRKTTLRVAAIAIFAATAALVGVLALQSSRSHYTGFDPGAPPISQEGFERREAGNLAVARNKGSDDVALRVNGYPITDADVREVQAYRRNRLEHLRRQAARIVPAGQPQPSVILPNGYNVYTDGISPISVHESGPIAESFAIADKYGVDVATLAKFLYEYASLTTAIAEGFGITDAELERHLDEWRAQAPLFARAPTMKYVYFNEAEYRKGVGERAYWNELMPARLYHYYSVLAWRKHHLREITNPDERSRLRAEIETTAYTNAVVEFTEHYELDATVEDAVAFIEDFAALRREQ